MKGKDLNNANNKRLQHSNTDKPSEIFRLNWKKYKDQLEYIKNLHTQLNNHNSFFIGDYGDFDHFS